MLNKFCLIIGTKKGATSSLYEYIRQHPKVAGGFKKEPNFFGNIKNWKKGLQWYQKQFVEYVAEQHDYGIDATTDYTQDGFINIPKRIKESNINVKFIYVVRDPFKKIESQTHQFLTDRDSIRPITECLDTRIIESAKYYKQVAKYLKFFDKKDFLFVDFERLRTDSKLVMKEINSFLELTDFQYDTSYLHNDKKSAIGQSFKSYRLLREFLRKLNITPLIPQIAKDKVRLGLGKYGGKKISEEDYKLTIEQKLVLKEELLLDAIKLEEEFGFNTRLWEIHKI
ncbi:sulfotransferase domain-containing protein [Lacinutrix jangbogonensis]|uniref:sulfotransferase domain-containing protein n=1 Tax=Lacinutrix jangbogonensis TaxID=1469557 RepID=UPI00053EB4B1|nr:sulfotransferase domain-containing protein [Lacinutrix jangbogonensis]